MRRSMKSGYIGVCGAVLTVGLLTGCSSPTVQVKGQLEVATGQVVSAGASSTLALSQNRAGKTLDGAVDTSLQDALTDIASEQSETASLDVTTPEQRALQQRTTRVVNRVADEISGARAALQEPSPARLQQAEQRVRAATDAADRWATQLGKGAP
jgi:hypothetical protein